MSDREATYRKDGRRIMDPPCEFQHTSQAMECPSCSERTTGKPSNPEWWDWYGKRRKERARQSARAAYGRAVGPGETS